MMELSFLSDPPDWFIWSIRITPRSKLFFVFLFASQITGEKNQRGWGGGVEGLDRHGVVIMAAEDDD